MKWKAIIIIIIIFAFLGIWMYVYYNGEDFKLYDEAKALEAKGDIVAAHDKVYEALMINPKNRKVIAYKSQLYFIVQSDTALKDAKKYRADALSARERGDFTPAAELLKKALERVEQISPLYKNYAEVVELQNTLIKDSDELLKEIPERYFAKATKLAQDSDYEHAYDTLSYINKPEPKVIKLQDELAYKVGVEKYNKAMNKGSQADIKEGILWLSKVSDKSPDIIDAKVKMSKLNKILNK